MILSILLERGPTTLTAVSTIAGLPKSTTHRLLTTLSQRRYARVLPDGRYALGSMSFRLASGMPRIDLELEYLRAQIGETINLGVLVGREVQYVARALSNQALRWGIDIGHRVPCYCSAMGKAIMAFRPNVHYEAQELVPLTEGTIVDPQALEEELRVIKEQGYALDREEYRNGVVCIGVPVADQSGTVIGSLSASGPQVRFSLEHAARYAGVLRTSAAVIGDLLCPAPLIADGSTE